MTPGGFPFTEVHFHFPSVVGGFFAGVLACIFVFTVLVAIGSDAGRDKKKRAENSKEDV